jgi:hypothetical protein
MKAALPYFAYAAAKTGDKVGLEKYLPKIQNSDQDFDAWLAHAFFAAVRHDADAAQKALLRARWVRPFTDFRPVMVEYQYAEACEIIGRETGDARFAQMALDWARRNQKMNPTHAWSYAMEAQYSAVSADRTRALAMALYLDPASPRIAGFEATRVAAARAWLKAHPPFAKQEDPHFTKSAQATFAIEP